MRPFFCFYLLSQMFMVVWSCQSQPSEIQPDNEAVDFEMVVEGLKNPWGMAFLPNGDILITEIQGEIRIVRDGQLLKKKIEGVPEVYVRGQGGLMDIELHPDFAHNQWLYLSYSSPRGGGNGGNTEISRFSLKGNKLEDQKILYKAVPNTTRGQHFGSRLEFDQEGYLYFSVGDRGNRDVNPQDITRDGGKIYRINDDGGIPEGNPFVGQSKTKEAIFSYGHRNPQGMAMDPATGKIWAHEHGPRGGDELNIVEPGKNYGWPVISYGINYNGTSFAEATAKEGMEQPVIYWVPSIAPCGMTFIKGDRYPGWEGDLILGSLKFSYLVHVSIEDGEVVGQQKVAEGIGRVRNVEQGPDGYLYVGIEGKGLYKLVRRES